MTLAPNRPPFHDHPFSIASAPSDLPRLRLVIGEVGDCTRSFEHVAPGTRVAVDGPHGSFVLPADKSPVILIAGGVGIAPLLGILEEAAANRDKRPFRLLYAARKATGLVYRERLRELQSQLDLLVSYLVDEGPREADCAVGPFRPNHVRELIAGADARSAIALVCGPAPMMEIASDALLRAGFPSTSVLYERFDYGAGKGRLDRVRLGQAIQRGIGLASRQDHDRSGPSISRGVKEGVNSRERTGIAIGRALGAGLCSLEVPRVGREKMA